jgi:cytochrome c1
VHLCSSTAILAAFMFAACAGADPLSAQDEALPSPENVAVYAAREAVKELSQRLKEQLMGAIHAGGPKSAIAACSTIAPDMAAAASQSHGLKVGRTALRLRNPANAPDAFERRVLEDFAKKIAAGADAGKLEHWETITAGEEAVVRYMNAIPTAAEPCLACHGVSVAPDLKAEILRLYPEDQATGFKAGELRGAFTATARVR